MISHLRKSPICFGCRKFLVQNPNDNPGDNEVSFLKDCSKCKYAKYCSVKCQKQDWKKDHKADCASLSGMTDTLEVFDAVYRCGKAKEITIEEVKNLQKKRRIHYSFKCDETNEQNMNRSFLEPVLPTLAF